MPASVSTSYHASGALPVRGLQPSARLCASKRFLPESLRRIQCIGELLGGQPSEHPSVASPLSPLRAVPLSLRDLASLLPRHEVRSANPLNLSI